ncbi:hypothetical protein CXB51_030653 [Gossypium anomalum]|uniref:Uncharacterized protein n=1 Tax=Gossypium anomalum TaxID=47600 RepID=A0A8J5XYR3_9ROSI|nr:hypothetical protein CXB51_030653 [Gossypium anomalum]
MENVVKNLIMDESDEKPEVGLMVMPGFWIGGIIVSPHGSSLFVDKAPFSLRASTVLLGLIACKNAADSLCFCIGTLDYRKADVRKRLWL